jgi:hypothetical protein
MLGGNGFSEHATAQLSIVVDAIVSRSISDGLREGYTPFGLVASALPFCRSGGFAHEGKRCGAVRL